jgi:tetratricopeptide (TPR) repeat protein
MRRSTILLAAFLATISTPGCAGSPEPPAGISSATPALDACAAALAPGLEGDERDRSIARLQRQVLDVLRSREALERLGYAYVARARVSNDPGDYKLAEKTAECLETRSPGDNGALLLKGHVLHQLHRFAEAEGIAKTLVARRTYVLDYGLLGDAVMEQGRLDEAAVAYQKMLDLKPFYQSYTRAAHVRWLKGDLVGAIEAMRLAIGAASPRDPESSAWAWTRLGVFELQAGRLDAALNDIDSALRYQPAYAAALLTRGRTLLAMKRVGEAVAVLREAARENPLPEYQWTLADALRLTRRDAEAAAVEAELVARGGATDPRTLSLYLSTRRTHVDRAIALADEELRNRADIFTLDARAWALAADGRAGEAVPLIARAVAEGTEDARLFLHAGAIYAASGRPREARRWLARAEHLKATLLPSESAELAKQLAGTPTNEEN